MQLFLHVARPGLYPLSDPPSGRRSHVPEPSLHLHMRQLALVGPQDCSSSYLGRMYKDLDELFDSVRRLLESVLFDEI